ncbi:MAG: SGNH/GDSL hydrolase family protein [Lentisphaeria bacterium]|nr:SGNH/GDSL hydrolase family protein [Lentisphaeria bacterium]
MKTLLFQGDSITDCSRAREDMEDIRHTPLGNGYAALLAAEIYGDQPEKDWRIFNRGISGNRVVDLYARWKKDALVLKPDVLSILIGVNDTWHEYNNQNGVEVPRYDEFLRRLLSWSLETLPELKIVLLEPFVLPFGAVGPEWPAEIAQRGEVVRQAAVDFGAVFVPLQNEFTKAAEKYGMEYWLRDGVHPTYAGHRLIAKQWMKAAGHLL